MIEVKNLVKKYGDHTAVDHLNFTVEKGKIYGFLGPNGAGKSVSYTHLDVYKRQKYGVSPTGSCLQMLIQMPIFFALYQVIIKIPGYISGMKHVFDSAVTHRCV